jgi:hypothetical protein
MSSWRSMNNVVKESYWATCLKHRNHTAHTAPEVGCAESRAMALRSMSLETAFKTRRQVSMIAGLERMVT